ncbi:Dabb family protein [Legionella sp. km772]|uniref:Dabb family protein n=1 Tax=Legionella sp. km772 TaxID=2498111 RepID=UPI000F8D07E2|nr:Dabb family protein [Legionella sp. km772]RUR08812.1 Dabb family protein [Legionella sp. km772]
MINHIVILQFKPQHSEADIEAALNQLSNLKNEIPSMKGFTFGKNLSPEQLNKGYTHAFVMTFEHAEGRDAYLAHAEHQRIASEVLLPMLEEGLDSVVVLDYEFA